MELQTYSLAPEGARITDFESVCCHPLFLFNEHGDCLSATLRLGNGIALKIMQKECTKWDGNECK
jgi:hypothetical protein